MLQRCFLILFVSLFLGHLALVNAIQASAFSQLLSMQLQATPPPTMDDSSNMSQMIVGIGGQYTCHCRIYGSRRKMRCSCMNGPPVQMLECQCKYPDQYIKRLRCGCAGGSFYVGKSLPPIQIPSDFDVGISFDMIRDIWDSHQHSGDMFPDDFVKLYQDMLATASLISNTANYAAIKACVAQALPDASRQLVAYLDVNDTPGVQWDEFKFEDVLIVGQGIMKHCIKKDQTAFPVSNRLPETIEAPV